MPPPSRDPLLGPTRPLVPPFYPSAVYVFPDLDALDRVLDGHEPGFIYARDAHPNARALAQDLARLEGGKWGLVTSSGMAAISAILLASLQKDDRVLAASRLYGRTYQLFSQELSRFGVVTEYVDANDLEQVEKALEKKPRLFFVETMSNPLLRVLDLAALAQLCQAVDCRLIVDNTFATPILTRPLELGADVVMESLTKIIAGHSDVTLGFLAGADPDLLTQLQACSSIWGFASNPFDCWLTQRGLDTLDLRLRAACDNASRLADWLPEHSGVRRVVYPGRPDHPDHDLAKKILDGGFGHMLCFELEGGRPAVNRFLRHAPGIPFSPSLGHTTTTCSHPATTSHRYVSPAERKRQGITDGLVRLSVGVEELGRIKKEMRKGLE